MNLDFGGLVRLYEGTWGGGIPSGGDSQCQARGVSPVVCGDVGAVWNCLGVKCRVGSGRRGVGDGGHTLLRIWSLTCGLNGAVKGSNSRSLA